MVKPAVILRTMVTQMTAAIIMDMATITMATAKKGRAPPP